MTSTKTSSPFAAASGIEGYSFEETEDNLTEAEAVADAIASVPATTTKTAIISKEEPEPGPEPENILPGYMIADMDDREADSAAEDDDTYTDDHNAEPHDTEPEYDDDPPDLADDDDPTLPQGKAPVHASTTTAPSQAATQATPAAPADRDTVILNATDTYTKANPPSFIRLVHDSTYASDFRAGLLTMINDTLKLLNVGQSKDSRFRLVSSLPGYVVAKVLIATGDVRMMSTGSSGYRIVVKHYYKDKDTGEMTWSGIYAIHSTGTPSSLVVKAMHALAPDANSHDEKTFERELANAPECWASNDNKIVFFRNGVWDYRRQAFTAYNDPEYDKYYHDNVSLSKLPVYHPYGPGAAIKPDENGRVREPVIHNDRDGTDWRPSQVITDPFNLSTQDGQASVLIIWQAAQFLIRKMNGAPHLYHFWVDVSGRGHNGKGTIWAMLKRLVDITSGSNDPDLKMTGDRVIALSVDHLDENYVLGESLLTAYAIVGEESDGAVTYIKNCATFKMLSRAQEITVRAIREKPFRYAFNGFLLQQSNKAPQFGEKNDSVSSHTCVINFDKSFNDARPYIKDDYVKREEVAEWLAYRLTVEMQCLEEYDSRALAILEPNKKDMMAESMNTFAFLDDVLPGLRMNFIPCEFLYDLYLRWCDKSGIAGAGVMQFKIFRDDVLQYTINHGADYNMTRKTARSSIKDCDVKHPALAQYCRSPRHNLSRFCHPRAREYSGYSEFCSQLSRSEWCSPNGSGKLWSKGGIIRVVKWQDAPDSMTPDENVEVAYDEDAGVDLVMDEVKAAASRM